MAGYDRIAWASFALTSIIPGQVDMMSAIRSSADGDIRTKRLIKA